MAPRACVSIESLALQLLLKRNPGWAGTPVAVTKDERPQSAVLAVNAAARERGVTPGQRYASALSLVPELKARAVPPQDVAEAREAVARIVGRFTPDIEPCPFDTDALWASAEGLRTLFGTEARWSIAVRTALKAEGWRAVVVVGFTRYGTYVLARSRGRSGVLASAQEERDLVARCPIDILPLPERSKAALRRLDVRTVGKLSALPPGETERRFGREAGTLLRALAADDPLPVQRLPVADTAPSRRHLDTPLSDLELLMAHVDELLAREAARAEAARCVIAGLTLVLRTEDGEVTTDLVRPSAPTLRLPVLRRLILLRLSARQLGSGIEDLEIHAARVAPSRAQEELFAVKGRDLAAGARTFAALRARFGNDAVTRAELADSWLPERSFRLVPVDAPVLPSARPPGPPSAQAVAVRRLFVAPRPAPAAAAGPVFELSGAWWAQAGQDAPYHRAYAFQDGPSGLRWCFTDRLDGTCWDHGVVD